MILDVAAFISLETINYKSSRMRQTLGRSREITFINQSKEVVNQIPFQIYGHHYMLYYPDFVFLYMSDTT